MNETSAPRSWQPGATLATAQLRASMLQTARDFFATHDILEVETPALSRAAASDPNIESIEATLAADPAHRYFLHTSPEFAMKRLLCAGWPDIYQICKVFRDGEVGDRHQPEFTMIEWYRRNIGLQEMISHTLQFIRQMLGPQKQAIETVSLSYREAFEQYLGLDPIAASISDLQQASIPDKSLLQALGDNRDHWLDLLLSTRIAPQFDPAVLVVIHHYPASQAALAQRCPQDPQVADRFEVFCGALELANGYVELTDANELQQRSEQDQQQRALQGLPQRPLDEELLAAMHAGLPPCCGVAIGFDRLVMLRRETGKLCDVQTFLTVDKSRA